MVIQLRRSQGHSRVDFLSSRNLHEKVARSIVFSEPISTEQHKKQRLITCPRESKLVPWLLPGIVAACTTAPKGPPVGSMYERWYTYRYTCIYCRAYLCIYNIHAYIYICVHLHMYTHTYMYPKTYVYMYVYVYYKYVTQSWHHHQAVEVGKSPGFKRKP